MSLCRCLNVLIFLNLSNSTLYSSIIFIYLFLFLEIIERVSGFTKSPLEKKSSGSQFYIVQGQVFTEEQLAAMQSSGHRGAFAPEEIEVYTTIGGTPHLDGSYTVFGEVVSGLDIVEKIAAVETDPLNRPVEDVVFSIRLK